MSKLCVGDDDHPLAATKHLRDAQALRDAGRSDGCAYLAGYVVECSLKAVLLHDDAWDPTNAQHDATKLRTCHRKLSGSAFGHKLPVLAAAQVGSVGAKYLPDLLLGSPSPASVLSWKETIRYRGEDPDPLLAASRSASYLEWAEHVFACSIVEMQLDGVL
jgi:hypothetical protein